MEILHQILVSLVQKQNLNVQVMKQRNKYKTQSCCNQSELFCNQSHRKIVAIIGDCLINRTDKTGSLIENLRLGLNIILELNRDLVII